MREFDFKAHLEKTILLDQALFDFEVQALQRPPTYF